MSRPGYISINVSAAKRADTVARGLALTKRGNTHGEVVEFIDEASRWYVGRDGAILAWFKSGLRPCNAEGDML